MSVKQDDILNEVIVNQDGTMTVDGNVIEVEQEEEILPDKNIARARQYLIDLQMCVRMERQQIITTS